MPDGFAGIWSHDHTLPLPLARGDMPLVVVEKSRVSVATRRVGAGLQLWLGTGSYPKRGGFVTGVAIDNVRLIYSGEITLEDALRLGAPPYGSVAFWPLTSGTYPLRIFANSDIPGESSAVAFNLSSVADPYTQWPPAPAQITGTYLHARLEDLLDLEDLKVLQKMSWKEGVAEIGVLDPDDPVVDRMREALHPLPATFVKSRIVAG